MKLFMFLTFIAVLFISCGEVDKTCTDNKIECKGNDYICNVGDKEAVSCEDICQKQGKSFTGQCTFSSAQQNDTCWCTGDGGSLSCDGGETTFSCNDDGTIDVCSNGMTKTIDCAESCKNDAKGVYANECSYSAEEGHDVCWCYVQ